MCRARQRNEHLHRAGYPAGLPTAARRWTASRWYTAGPHTLFGHCAALPAGLRELDLHGCAALEGGALRSLADLRQLTALCLDQCGALRDGHLPAVAALTALRRLSLAGCRGVGGGAGLGPRSGLSVLAALPHLSELSLAGLVRLRDEGLAGLGAATALTALHLDLCPSLRCGPCSQRSSTGGGRHGMCSCLFAHARTPG